MFVPARLLKFVAVAAIAGVIPYTAKAETLSALSILGSFNTVIYGNATTTSDIEGAAVIGGNFKGATVNNNPLGVAQPAGFGTLTVYGSTSGNPINLNNGGTAYVGGSRGAIVNFNGGGGYLSTAPSQTIGTFQTTLNGFSTALSHLSANSYLPATDNNELIKATPNAAGIAVFNITADQLGAIPSYQFSLNGAKTVVFNVSGSTVDVRANAESGVTGASNIIWNFYQATSVKLETQIAGTILATLANVTNNNQIDGALVAASWSGTGELHNYAFSGVSPVPLPAALPMFASAVVAFGAIARRRKKRN